MLSRYASYDVYASEALLVVDEEHPTKDRVIPRTFRERWLALPWRPWVKSRTVQVANMVPDPNFYVDHAHRTITAHPVMVERLREALRRLQ